jgi:hypothetical protein
MARYDLQLQPETKLERAVARWLRSEARDRNGSVRSVLRDLFYGGCASGIVGDLIYTSDAAKFYRRHRTDIGQLVRDWIESTGAPFSLTGWDDSDPFAEEDSNRNLLAWFGFERAAQNLADRAGYDG